MAHPGKGTYIYVAYALYRQLPELVPGAYRLLANLLSAGKAMKQPAVEFKLGSRSKTAGIHQTAITITAREYLILKECIISAPYSIRNHSR